MIRAPAPPLLFLPAFALIAAAATVAGTPAESFARPPPRTLGLDLPGSRHRSVLEQLRRTPPIFPANGELGDHRLELVEEHIQFDPATGVATTTVSVTITAGPGGFSNVLLLVDEGLIAERAFDANGDLPYQEDVFFGTRYVQIDLPQRLPQGEQKTMSVTYAGRLLCPQQGGYASCDFGPDRLPFANNASLFAAIYDPVQYDTTAYYRRVLHLTIPAGSAAYVSANEVSRDIGMESTTIHYEVPVCHDLGAFIGVFGELVEREVEGTSIPARIVHLRGEEEWLDDFETWTPKIVAFLDEQAGQTFPYPMLNVVKLPERARFPGTAGPAMTLLSEVYGAGSDGDRYFEETLAHEASHIWWAVLTTDENVNTRFLSEGLATFSQIEYTGLNIRTDLDHDTYLGRRYNEMENIQKYSVNFRDLPPVQPAPGSGADPGQNYTEWAYLKGATILDFLRISITDDRFAAGLKRYAEECRLVPCTTDDFEAAMTAEAGEDLGWFFEQYVRGDTEVELAIDFVATDSGVDVTLEQAQPVINNLELWLVLEDGTIEKARILVSQRSETFSLPASGKVVGVRPNPRYEPMIAFRSANDRDVDFDAELDGADLVRCAFQVGKSAIGMDLDEGVTIASVRFESRCDTNGDGEITEGDLDTLIARFPEVR